MPDGSSGPPFTSTSNITTLGTFTSTLPPPLSSPLITRRLNSPNDKAIMKAKIFSNPASPTGTRPKTAHQSIRGRISGPIPIDDDEFPIRNPGTGIASSTPIEDDEALQREFPLSNPKPASPLNHSFPPAAQSFTGVTGAGRMDLVDVPQTVPEHPCSPSPHPPTPAYGPSPEDGASSSTAARSSPRYHRKNQSSSALFSTVSATSNKTGEADSAGGHDVTGSGPPQRKKSVLRSALNKFLRRGKKAGSLSSVSEADRKPAVGGPPPQHRSVPPAARVAKTQSIEPAKRVASMPINEFDRALRSHSVGPDDITAIESARNSIDPLGSSPNRRRTATALNKKSFTATSPRSRGEEWAGLSPRPASTHARASRFHEEDPDEIGRAITSDSGGEIGHKRRSRSLSQLNELAQEQRDPKRRSEELRFWRASYDIPGPLSPLSSAPNENENEINDDNFDTGRASMSVADSSAVDHAPQTPPQPFNFGSLASMNEMAGMKITQAASLDDRFGNLEARVYKLQRVVSQLCHSVPGFKEPFMEVERPPMSATGGRARSGSGTAAGHGVQHVSVGQPSYAYSTAVPPMIPSIYQVGRASREVTTSSSRYANSRHSVDTEDDNDSSRMSFGEGQTYIDSLHPPSSSATRVLSTAATSVPPLPGLLRPNSESTVRPMASMPSLGSSTEEHSPSKSSVALMAQLEAERAARQALESQVRKLSERMNNLSSTMFAMVRDPAKSRSSEKLRPQTAAAAATSTMTPTNTAHSATHPAPASVNNGKPAIALSSKAQSIFGNENSAALSSITSSPSNDVGDDEFSEAFQTPKEEPGQQHELFGGVDEFGGRFPEETDDDDEDLDRKNAARTLSLSQLTLGKGLPPGI